LEATSEEKLMSAQSTTRRVAVFTLFLFTAVVATTTGASAMRPEPPASATRGHSHHAPTGTASSGADISTWLLTAVAVLAAVAIAAGIAAAVRHHRIQPPAAAAH
jgi:hypothetical protein